MKRFWKLLTVALLICAMGLTALPISAQNDAVDSLVVLGDSISTGYGLNGELYTRASYSNLVASALGLSAGNGYINYAVDGYTSAQILQKAKDNQATVTAADLIIMTNGGNDVLSKMLMIAMKAAGVDSLNLTQIAIALAQMTTEEASARLYSAENVNTIATALVNYKTNLTLLLEYLKTAAPDTRVLVLTQYNPLSGLTMFGMLDSYAETVIGQMNDIMNEVVTAAGYEIVDTHAVMVGQGAVMSNIMSADIHPNALGHAKMAEMVKNYLGLVEPAETEPEQTTTAEPAETTAEPDETTPVPVETTAEQIATTAEPEETTTEPLVTTAEPAETTTAPAAAATTTPGTSATTTPAVATTPAATTTADEPATTAGTSAPETEPDPTTDTTATESEPPAVTSGNTEQPPAVEEKSAAPAVIVGGALIGVGVIALIVAVCVRKKH